MSGIYQTTKKNDINIKTQAAMATTWKNVMKKHRFSKGVVNVSYTIRYIRIRSPHPLITQKRATKWEKNNVKTHIQTAHSERILIKSSLKGKTFIFIIRFEYLSFDAVVFRDEFLRIRISRWREKTHRTEKEGDMNSKQWQTSTKSVNAVRTLTHCVVFHCIVGFDADKHIEFALNVFASVMALETHRTCLLNVNACYLFVCLCVIECLCNAQTTKPGYRLFYRMNEWKALLQFVCDAYLHQYFFLFFSLLNREKRCVHLKLCDTHRTQTQTKEQERSSFSE